MFPACAESSRAWAQPYLGLPTAVLARLGELVEAELERAADLGRIAAGPGAFTQGPAGRGSARLGKAALATMIPPGIFCRGEPASTHEVSGGLNAGEVAEFRHRGHGDGELDATPALEGIDHRSEPPGWRLVLECWFETLKTCRLVGDRAHVCLEDERRRGCRTDDRAEPAEVGRPV
jgi:hypothetical protein